MGGDAFLGEGSDGGSHYCEVEGWDWSSGQFAVALWALQLVEGEACDGVFAGAVGEGCLKWGFLGLEIERDWGRLFKKWSRDTAFALTRQLGQTLTQKLQSF